MCSALVWHIVRLAARRVPTVFQFFIFRFSKDYKYCDILLGLEKASANFLTL